MKKYLKIFFTHFLVAAAGLLSTGLNAQINKSISTNAGTMKLSGTSTMHDWDMNGIFKVDGKYNLEEGTNKLKSVSGLNFVLGVENLKSDKKRLDETAYKALKAETYKEIYFKMTSATIQELQTNRYKVVALGNLTIAGVTRTISMEVLWIMHADHTITCAGIQKLKMTDYNVQPPSFLGFMKTGDDIALDFTFEIKS